jgi:hypothetical protein
MGIGWVVGFASGKSGAYVLHNRGPAPSVLSPTRFGGVVGVRPGWFLAHCAFEPRPHDILLIGGVLAAALTNYRKK